MAKLDTAHAIRIRGAREHNLKNVNVDLPRDKLVVITGLSGSGKSTLAFDTVYAEGQRRYVESLSAYARQFLQMLQKPDVESIEGLTPTIAIEQRSGHANPRSTVATTTEIYDFLRVLFARIGTPHCHVCGREIEGQSAQQIVDRLQAFPEGTRLTLMAPLVRGRKGEHKDILDAARREGFARLRVDGEIIDTRQTKALAKTFKHTIEAVIDRIVVKAGGESRLTESVELALKVGDGLLLASAQESDADKPKDHLFSERYACPVHGVGLEELSPRMFSFNGPYGSCPTCVGLGTKMEVDVELLVPERKLSVDAGLIKNLYKLGYNYGIWYGRAVRRFCKAAGVDTETPIQSLPKPFFKALMHGAGGKAAEKKFGRAFRGLVPSLTERFHRTQSEMIKTRIHEFMSALPCPDCNGARLRPEVLAVKVGGKSIHELSIQTIERAQAFFHELPLDGEKKKIAQGVLKEIGDRLGFLVDVGLAYLTLDRTSGTLSGGEAQRIRLASQVGSKLVGVTYVLDEPTIGLHQRDNDRLLKTLLLLRDLGNTVLVVEHDEDVIRRADWIVDMGPRAGEHGGEVVASGDLKDLARAERSLTGKYLSGELEIALPRERRANDSSRAICVRGAAENNLKRLDADLPVGRFVCVTGVSGSGKSSLVNEVLYKSLARQLHNARAKPGACDKVFLSKGAEIDKIIDIDQSPIGRTPRSNPATYTGVFDEVRKLFAQMTEAKIRGYSAGRFSFNVKGGRCEACQGQGVKAIEMHFLADVYVTCEVCKGQRFNRETLEVRYKAHHIAEVLDLSVEAALKLFANHPKIKDGLQTLYDVGLGYVRLGQSSTTLSGGEAQRIKLAFELAKKATGNTLYVLDEPTTGLHFHDIAKLLDVLQRLVDLGNTVVVIEHNLDVIKQADWIVDLGPEGGEGGGVLVAAGTPEEIARHPKSYTGQYLKRVLRQPEPAAAK
ncbi:MAG: excinuclease ABC subunit UvrA [Planctomycetota bacterium]|nr:excinuclease ABC subunit UvrA [Planctomycetota bacterium]